MQRLNVYAIALIAGLAACSGPAANSSMPNAPTSGMTPVSNGVFGAADQRPDNDKGQTAKAAIGAINAAGSYVNSLAEENSGEKPINHRNTTGACHDGHEFYAPDRHGDPNSTESLAFYEPSCGQVARDTVRIYTSTGTNSETVALTITNYLPQGSTISTRTSAVTFSNATFGPYGVPEMSAGFVREASSQLVVGTAKTNDGDNEFIVQPANGNVNAFCSDYAGFNATGIASLNATFGWSGGVLSGGTRTENADGSVTWTGSRDGTLYEGPIGGLSITKNAQNSACPISTPAYSIAGGTVKGSSVGSMTVTFKDGAVESLSASRVSVSGGYAMTMNSNPGVQPTSPNFISGTISHSGSEVATFNVNTFGDGVLTVTKTGKQFAIVSWTVVR